MEKVNNTVIDIYSDDLCASIRPNKKITFTEEEREEFEKKIKEAMQKFSNSSLGVRINGANTES